MICLRKGLSATGQRLVAPGHRWTGVGLCGTGVVSACYLFHQYHKSRAAAQREKYTLVGPAVQRTTSNSDLLTVSSACMLSSIVAYWVAQHLALQIQQL